MRHSIATFACLVSLAACGGGDGDGPSGAAPTSSAAGDTPPVALQGTVTGKGVKDLAGATTLDLALADRFFAPTFVQGLPGSTITVNLTNEGAMPHTFTIAAPKVDVTVEPGKTGTASVTLPASGALAFYCRFHKDAGMQGAFFDKPGATAGTASGDDGGAYGQ